METFINTVCLSAAAIAQIFNEGSEGTSLGPVSVDMTNTAEIILHADGENQTISSQPET